MTQPAPVITGFISSNKSIFVQFSLPNNSPSITSLLYSVNGATDISTNTITSPLFIPNLVEGLQYSVALKAYSNLGISAYSDISFVTLPYSFSNTQNPISIQTNGEVFVMTVKNELNNNYNYKYSYDGINWTSSVFPVSTNPSQIKWLGNQFCVLGDKILKSTDGIDFSVSQNTISPTLTNTNDIETNTTRPHSIVFPIDTTLCCSSQQIATSNDGGFTWSVATTLISNGTIKDAIWMGTQWIIVSNYNIVYSSDTVSWVKTPVPLENPKSIEWNAKQHMLVLVGDGGVATSSDGVYWIVLGKLGMDVGENVTWNGEKWIVYGYLNSQNVKIESEDGMWWSTPQNTTFPVSFSPTIYNQTQYLYIDSSAILQISYDGTTWSPSTSSPFQTHTALAWNQSTTGVTQIQPYSLALGSGDKYTMALSEDGIIWRGLEIQYLDTRTNDAVWTGEYWVAVGLSQNNTTWCIKSYDGLIWTASPDTGFTEGLSICWNGVVLLAVGNTGTIAVSIDGIEWEHVSGISVSQTNTRVIWNGMMWILFTTAGIWTTTNIYGNGNWQLTNHVYPFDGGIIQTPWEIYVQSATELQKFSKYNTSMTLVDMSVNCATITSLVTSYCFDGSFVLVGCADGKVGILDSSNNTFVTHMTTTLSSAVTMCYNNLYSIVGEISGNIWYGKTPNWELGYNLPIITLKKVVSNSKYGTVYVPNTLYMDKGDQLLLTTPKYLNIPQTSINIDLLRYAVL